MTTEKSPGESGPELPARLVETLRQFQHWRSSRLSKSCQIPPELWAAAAGCAERFGVHRTALALGLDSGKLKRKLISSTRRGQKRTPAFVELLPASRPPATECVVELESPTGSRLRIHLRGAVLPDLSELARSFSRQGS